MKLCVKITLAIFLLTVTVKAQYTNKLHFRNISVNDGLSYPIINCILQDQNGFIWVGTGAGLNKYDSQKFKVYYADPNMPGSLSNDHINCLYEDEQQRLWVGTLSGLNIYDSETGTFLKFKDEVLATNKILAITGDKKGNYWAMTNQYLILIDHQLKPVRKYAVSDVQNNEAISIFSTCNTDDEGNLWVNTDQGLRRFDKQIGKLTNPLNDSNQGFTNNIEFYSN